MNMNKHEYSHHFPQGIVHNNNICIGAKLFNRTLSDQLSCKKGIQPQIRNMSVCIDLGGCVGMIHAMFGVGAVIQESYDLKGVILRTRSGSNFLGACIAHELDVSIVWRLWCARQQALYEKYPWTYFFRLMGMAESHICDVIGTTAKLSIQHQVLLGFVDRWARFFVHMQGENYTKALIAGAFIPLLFGALWSEHPIGGRCVDGEFPLLPRSRESDACIGNAQVIYVRACPEMTPFGTVLQMLCWKFTGLLGRRNAHFDDQFSAGQKWARNTLIPKLDKLLPLSTSETKQRIGQATADVVERCAGRFNYVDHGFCKT
jgi:hypothetical protein